VDLTWVSRWALFELLRVPSNLVRRRLRTDIDVHLDLNARITVDTSQGDAVHLAGNHAAERCSTNTAKAEPHSVARFEPGHFLRSLKPGKGSRFHLRIGGASPAERLPATRAVATSSATQRRTHAISNATAEAPTSRHPANSVSPDCDWTAPSPGRRLPAGAAKSTAFGSLGRVRGEDGEWTSYRFTPPSEGCPKRFQCLGDELRYLDLVPVSHARERGTATTDVGRQAVCKANIREGVALSPKYQAGSPCRSAPSSTLRGGHDTRSRLGRFGRPLAEAWAVAGESRLFVRTAPSSRIVISGTRTGRRNVGPRPESGCQGSSRDSPSSVSRILGRSSALDAARSRTP